MSFMKYQPGGYRVSEDQEFIMPLGQETKEIRFVNYAISSGGGGGGTLRENVNCPFASTIQ